MKKILISLGIGIICFLILFLLFNIGFLNNINVKLTDNLYGGLTPADNIIIIAIDDASLQEIGIWPWNRTVYADLMPKLNQSKIIGIDVAFFEPTDDDEILADAFQKSNVIIPVEYTSFEIKDEIYGKEILEPPEPIKSSAKLAYVNILTDNDGMTRAINMDIKGDYENFAYEVYKNYWNIELVKKDRFLVNFVGKPNSYTQYSFSDVLKNDYDFKDKIILIGATSPDLHDDYFVPTSEGKAMPGVEVHANAIQTMITQKFLSHSSYLLTGLIILIIAIITSLLLYFFRIRTSAIVLIILIIAYIFLTIKIFNHGLILNIIYMPLTVLITFIAKTSYFYSSEKIHKNKITKAFGKYVSPVIVDEIVKNPDKLKLGGEKRELSIFFSDIRGFTSISEKMEPEKLASFLNQYLTEMAYIVMKNKGLVDKYIGDAVMALWNAPLNEENHPELACITALEMKSQLKELNKKWETQKLPEMRIGMGINTGKAVVGNLGSLNRFDYTAIGDSVNLAARLESITKQYSVDIIISEFTYEKIKDKFSCRLLDKVAVKGKTEPIKIYELICKKEDLTETRKQLIERFESALKDYFNKDFEKAIQKFEIIKDKPSLLFIDRCNEFLRNPPPENWDGAFIMKTK